MNNNDETKQIKIGGDIKAITSADHTLITINIPVDITFQAEKTAEEIEEIAFDEIDILASAVADQTVFIGEQLVAAYFSQPEIMKLGDGLKALGKFSAGLLEVSDSLRFTAERRREENLKLKFVTSSVNADAAERRTLIEKFTTKETSEMLSEYLTEVDNFTERILTVEFASPEYKEMYQRFIKEMMLAVNEGQICTPERMAKLYPVFREINIEAEKAESAPAFIPTAENVLSISDIPHSRPPKKRTPMQKPKIRTKKAEKPKNKQQ